MPCFTFAFALLDFREWGLVHNIIEIILERGLCYAFGCSVPKRFKVLPGVWSMVCGYPNVFALLRQLKLEMAARLKVGNNKAGRIFRALYLSERGSFEDDVYLALKEWLLLGQWDDLTLQTVAALKRKV